MRVPRTLLRALAVGATAVAAVLPACAAYAEPTPGQVASQIEQASTELEKVIEAYNGIGENLKKSQAASADVGNRIAALKTQLDTAEGTVRLIASAAYRGSSNLTTFSVLLEAGSPDGLVDQVATLQYVNRSKQRDIDRYTQTKGQLEAERKHFDALVSEQTEQQRQIAERKTKIESDIRDLEALRRRLNAPPPGPAGSPGPPPDVSGAAGAAVSFAYNQIGKPYVYGAAGPSGYDCSGLTQAAWKQAGVNLPHNAAQQWSAIPHVGRGSLAPGDLVFYSGLGHVGIYIGNGSIIHAPTTGDVVRTASVDMMTPYGYGRPG